MSHQILHLRKGQKFQSFEELDVFITQFQLQEGHQYSVHKSKTIKPANVQKKIEEKLVYYSMHYTCQRSGTYKSKGKGLRKTKSIKTNCPAFIELKVSRNGDYLEIDKFDGNHNHPPLDMLTQGQPQSVCDDDECADGRNRKVGLLKSSGDNLLQVKVPELESGEGCESQDASLDIASLSIYIAQETNTDKKSTCIDLNDDNLNVTLPILSIAGIPSNLELVKVNISNDGADSHCLPQHKLEKTNRQSNFQPELAKTSEEPLFEDDLAAILRTSELLAKDKEDIPIFDARGNKEQEELESNLELNEDGASISAIPENPNTGSHEPIIYSMSTVQASSVVTVDTMKNTLDIDMPPIQRSRGRPKGAALTAIGLPRRRNYAIDFNDKLPAAKAKTILGWLIPDRILNNVLLGEYKITKNDIVHLTAETLTDAIVDDLVDLSVVKEYFDERGFTFLLKSVSKKHALKRFKCLVCNEVVERDCVLCHGCLLWHHFSCVKLKRAPKTASWFCTNCMSTR